MEITTMMGSTIPFSFQPQEVAVGCKDHGPFLRALNTWGRSVQGTMKAR